MYLKVLNLTKKELANYFEMQDTNLHEYLSGIVLMNVFNSPSVILSNYKFVIISFPSSKSSRDVILIL